jgi:hypothetical protein
MHQIDRRAQLGDRVRGDLVSVVHRSRNPVGDGDELREWGIDHDGGHQSLDITQKALLGGVGSAHAR